SNHVFSWWPCSYASYGTIESNGTKRQEASIIFQVRWKRSRAPGAASGRQSDSRAGSDGRRFLLGTRSARARSLRADSDRISFLLLRLVATHFRAINRSIVLGRASSQNKWQIVRLRLSRLRGRAQNCR